MIEFSQFLQDNEKKKSEADKKRSEENNKIEILKKQIDKKKEQYQILLDKQTRINLKVKAMKKYEAYLESVRDRNPDEYQELNDILSRYWTLKNSNNKLTENMKNLERELEDLKTTVANYEKDMNFQIMQLNNEIGGLQLRYEQIEDQKNKLKSEAEETRQKKSSKISDLARILMAIDNLEKRCLNRKEKSALKYPLQQLVNLEDPKNFNMFKQRAVYAKAQLTFIQQYLEDFNAIIKNVLEPSAPKDDKEKAELKKKEEIKAEIKRMKDNNEII